VFVTTSNVTLHVARTPASGKQRWKSWLTNDLRNYKQTSQGDCRQSSVFCFCVHKRVEHLVPEKADLGVQEVASAHWGALDGSNAYKDFDTAVIFGLPFRDRIWEQTSSSPFKGPG